MKALSHQDRVDSVDICEQNFPNLVASWHDDLAVITGQAYTWSTCGLFDSNGEGRPVIDCKQSCRLSCKDADGLESLPLSQCISRIAQCSSFAVDSEQVVPLFDMNSSSSCDHFRYPAACGVEPSGCDDAAVIEAKFSSRNVDPFDFDVSALGQSWIDEMNLHFEGQQTWCAVRSHCNMSVWTASQSGRGMNSDSNGNTASVDCPYFGFPNSINFCGMTSVVEFEPQVSCVGSSHDDHTIPCIDKIVPAAFSMPDALHDRGWHTTDPCPQKNRRSVAFASRVDIHVFCGNQAVHFGVDEHIACYWLRNFWHLHGQTTTWNEIKAQVMRLEVTTNGESDSNPLPAQITVGKSSSTQIEGENKVIGDDAVLRNYQRWWDDLLQVWTPELNTWFLCKGRLEVCLEARRIHISHRQSFQNFLRDCRRTWLDWDDGSDLSFHVVHPKPLGLPSTLAHVIIVQGSWQDENVAFYHGSLLPVLRRQRAVMYRRGSTVKQFFLAAQHPEVCQNPDFTCYLKVVTDG